MQKSKVAKLSIVALLCLVLSANAGLFTTYEEFTWESDEEGWLAGGTGAGSLTQGDVNGTGVNGLQISADTGAGISTATIYYNPADTDFSNTGDGESQIRFDFYANAAPSGLQLYFVGGTATWYYDLTGLTTGWQSFEVTIGSPSGWTDLGASSTFADEIAGITEIGFQLTYLENTAGQVYGFDDFRRGYAIPEPETYAMLAFALLSVAFTFRKRIKDYIDAAVASMKA